MTFKDTWIRNKWEEAHFPSTLCIHAQGDFCQMLLHGITGHRVSESVSFHEPQDKGVQRGGWFCDIYLFIFVWLELMQAGYYFAKSAQRPLILLESKVVLKD